MCAHSMMRHNPPQSRRQGSERGSMPCNLSSRSATAVLRLLLFVSLYMEKPPAAGLRATIFIYEPDVWLAGATAPSGPWPGGGSASNATHTAKVDAEKTR